MYSMLVLVMGLAPILCAAGRRPAAAVLGLAGGDLPGPQRLWRFVFHPGLLRPGGVAAGGAPHACQGLGSIPRRYGGLLGDGRYIGYTVAGGLALAAMFAYISGSPFVFIELNGVPPSALACSSASTRLA